MQPLFDFADMLDLRVEYARFRDRDGEYRHDLKRIRLREGMTPRRTRSILAHELGHAVFEDVPSMFGPVNARQERRADEWAAARLISIDRYREVELIREGHIASMAHDLNVIPRLVEAFQRILERELHRVAA